MYERERESEVASRAASRAGSANYTSKEKLQNASTLAVLVPRSPEFIWRIIRFPNDRTSRERSRLSESSERAHVGCSLLDEAATKHPMFRRFGCITRRENSTAPPLCSHCRMTIQYTRYDSSLKKSLGSRCLRRGFHPTGFPARSKVR